MGLWDRSKPSCDFTGDLKVSDFQGKDRPRPAWMDLAKASPSAPVYMDTPGGAVFKSICYRCHGLLADSKGLLADAISTFTGGDARVADFRDGLFGPVSAPGTNRARVFGDYLTQHSTSSSLKGITSDDIAVRYIAYMALGGTQKHLPTEVLNEVIQTPVFGQTRNHLTLTGTANMLQLGATLCSQIAVATTDAYAPFPVTELASGGIHWSEHTGLIDTSGDADLWLKLCALNNRSVVHVVAPEGGTWRKDDGVIRAGDLEFNGHSEYWGQTADGKPLYPADAPVIDHHGIVHQGITDDNPFPVCAKKPEDPAELQAANTVLKSLAVGGPGGAVIPYCPAGIAVPENKLDDGGTTFPDGKKWATRGAINAAMAVFLYLDQIERDPSTRQPPYNQCDQRQAASK